MHIPYTLMRQLAAGLLAAGLSCAAHLAQAAPARLLLETKVDNTAGAELFQVSYASVADFRAAEANALGFLPQDIAPNFSVADIAYEHGRYHMLLEANSNLTGRSEVYLLSYASWADLQANNPAVAQVLPLDIAAGFSVHGFTYDGDAFRLLLETDADRNGGEEVYMVSYASYDDLLTNWSSGGQFLAQDISPDFSVAGLAFDDGVYRLLLESSSAADGSNQLFMASYSGFDDWVGNNASELARVAQSIRSDFSVRGFEFESTRDAGPGPSPLPEPASWALVLVSLASCRVVVRRRDRRQARKAPRFGKSAHTRNSGFPVRITAALP